MIRTVMACALLAAALVVTIPGAIAAQDQGSTPEGTKWYLTAYDSGGPELTPVPWDMVGTLMLDAGRAIGSTGCNEFSGRYERDGRKLTYSPIGWTERGCPDEAWVEIEAAYMAALPKTARWSIDAGAARTGESFLTLIGDDGELLVFSSSGSALLRRQVDDLTALVEAQQQEIATLQARLMELETAG